MPRSKPPSPSVIGEPQPPAEGSAGLQIDHSGKRLQDAIYSRRATMKSASRSIRNGESESSISGVRSVAYRGG